MILNKINFFPDFYKDVESIIVPSIYKVLLNLDASYRSCNFFNLNFCLVISFLEPNI